MNEKNDIINLNKNNKTPYLLNNWSIICITENIKYKAPELFKYSLQGFVSNNPKFPNNILITTSAITDVKGLIVETISKSIYKLDGSPHKDYQKYCDEKKIIIDKENPIKIFSI